MWTASPSGNQRTRPNQSSNRTAEPLASPVDVSDFAEFIGVEPTDPMLSGFLLAATQACIDHTNYELLERTYTYKLDRAPQRQAGYTGVGIMASLSAWSIELPLWPVKSIESVTFNGEAATPDFDLDSKPARVEIAGRGAVVIEYTAGHAEPEEIDARLLLGIKLLAAYLYEHRGACEMTDAIAKSGARGMWGAGMVMTL
jgi:hypothetical protein